MKKRIIYLATSLILIVVLAIGLIGCVPSRPDKFLQKIFIAESWSVIEYDIDGSVTKIVIRDKNSRYVKGSLNEQYVVYTREAVEIYTYGNEVWSYKVYTEPKDVEEWTKNQIYTPLDIVGTPDLRYFATDFKTKFSKKDGKWVELSTNPATFYVKGQKLYYEKGDRKIEYSLKGNVKISDEALQAKNNAISKGWLDKNILTRF